MTRSSCVGTVCIACIIFPTAPVWVPIWYGYKLFRHVCPRPPASERAYRRRYAHKPRQLPFTRLLLSEVALSVENAENSPFLRLPREIREKIYSYLFVNRFIFRIKHSPKDRRLVQSHCLYPPTWHERQHIRTGPERWCGFHVAMPGKDINPALIKTCRQIYTEVTPLIYSTNTFDIGNLDDLIFLNQTIRSNRMASIRFLRISWSLCFLPFCDSLKPTDRPHDDETWLRFWNIIATRMIGLTDLDVTLRVCRPYELNLEKIWLKPLMDVRGLRHFILEIVYNYNNLHDPEGEVLAFRKEIERAVCQPRN